MDDILIWKQSSWLTEANIIDAELFGVSDEYESYVCRRFEGLALSDPDKTYLDGSPDSSCWWQSVGAFGLHNGGIPGHNWKIAYSQSLYILNNAPLLGCLNQNRSGPSGWYTGDSIDIANLRWIDISGNYLNGIIDDTTGFSIKYLNEEVIISGTVATKIRFPVQFDSTQHTIFYVTRYVEQGTKARIIQTDLEDGAFGHVLGNSGIAIERTPITDPLTDNFGDAWVISSQQANLYRGNKIDYTINTDGDGFTLVNDLVINQGYRSSEVSDFEIAELIVFNEILDLAEIECIEDYLQNKYQLPSYSDYLLWTLPSSSFTWSDVYPDPKCQLPQISPQIYLQAWCTQLVPNDGSWLQVDLGSVHIIESVSTWGRNSYDQWVTSYELHYSLDGITFTAYSGNPLTGNSDTTTEQQNFLTSTIMAKYLRFIPLSYYGWKSMRVEATGFNIGSYLLWSLPDSSFTWKDAHTHCEDPKIDGLAWCTSSVPNPGSWLQVDLGNVYEIESVSTWGRESIANQWVTSYALQYSLDSFTFTEYIGNPLTGNSDMTTEQQNFLTPNIMARYLRFIPLSYNNWKSMRIEATGTS